MRNPAEFVLLIVLIVLGYKIVRLLIERRHDERLSRPSSEQQDMESHIEHLEERIRVLEKIVTDGSSGRDDLRRQFRDLER